MKYKIIFAYDGTSYLGYAKQKVSTLPSIQETLESNLSLIFQEEITLKASGRTDKGVHALNQVADFESSKTIDCRLILRSLEKLLPSDIYVKSCELVDDSFSSRFNAKSKTYIYVVTTLKEHIFFKNYCVYEDRLNLEKMEEALPLFLGTHDFKNFTSKDIDEGFNFIRTINYFKIIKKDGFLVFEINGNGFMRYMVRKIVGVVLRIGLSKLDKDFIPEHLDTKERNIINFTAPSKGLFLKEVNY